MRDRVFRSELRKKLTLANGEAVYQLADFEALVDVVVHCVDGERVADAPFPAFRRFELLLGPLCRRVMVKTWCITVICLVSYLGRRSFTACATSLR